MGSHVSPSEVGSSGRSERSQMRSEARAAVELEALQHLAIDETASERNDQQAWEASYIGSPETIQGDNGEEDKSNSEEDSNEENEEESETSPVVEAKGMEPSRDGPEGRGVDG